MGSGDGLGSCYSCIKYLMFGFNFVFWLVGCGLVGVGIWILVDDTLKEMAKVTALSILTYSGIAIIALGAIIMVIGFFGCCGAIRESQCLLSMFFVVMFILFGALVGAGVYCLVFNEQFVEKVTETWEAEASPYEEEKSPLVNAVQKIFSCCGLDNAEEEYSSFVKKETRYPLTCPRDEDSPSELAEGTKPCRQVVTDFLNENGTVLGGVSIGVGVVMLMGMIFSILLCCAVRQDDN